MHRAKTRGGNGLPAFCWAALLAAVALPATAQTVVTGRLVGADGAPMAPAYVEVFTDGEALRRSRLGPGVSVRAGEDGTYRLELTGEGLVRLFFSGPFHRDHVVPLLLGEPRSVGLDVRLEREYMDPDQSFTRITGNFNGYDYETGVPLRETEEGSFAAFVTAPLDTVLLKMPGLTKDNFEGWEVGDVTADGFVYLGRGEYVPYLVGSGRDSVEVRIRPVRSRPGDQWPGPDIAFSPDDTDDAFFATYYTRFWELDYRAFFGTIRPADVERAQREQVEAVQRYTDDLASRIDAEADPFRRRVLLVHYLQQGGGGAMMLYRGRLTGPDLAPTLEPRLVRQALEEIPPSSVLWTVVPVVAAVLVDQLGYSPAAMAYAEAVLEAVPEDDAADLLGGLFQRRYARHGLDDIAAGLSERLIGRYAGHNLAAWAAQLLDQQRATPAGTKAPDFRVLQVGTLVPLTMEQFAGRPVLLDFWTPDCEGCRRDLSTLRAAHDAFASRGLQILSVALTQDEDAIFEALALPEPLRWHHAADFEGFEGTSARGYGVRTVPHRVLIDAEGTIRAAGAALSGERLLETLREALGVGTEGS